jgi:type III restriction enzyme
VSHDLQSNTLFGDYRVDGAVMKVGGYNELLSRLTRRIAQAQSQPLPGGNRISDRMALPYLQSNTTALAAALDTYVRERLFAESFEPFQAEGWRLLLLTPVVDHVVKVFGLALAESERVQADGFTEVRHRRLSEVDRIMVRESSSLEVQKCIYDRLGYPSRGGGLERAFIQWAQADAGIVSFCKLSEHRHDFVRLRYIKNDGLSAYYHPDFLVRTADAIYLVETKAQDQVSHPNVQRKLKAAVTWCQRINALEPGLRDGREWFYALVGESNFHEWRNNGGRLGELLAFSKVRGSIHAEAQGGLDV